MAYEDDEYVDDYEPEVAPSGEEDDWEPAPAEGFAPPEEEEPPPLPRARPSAEEQAADDAENAPPYQVAGAPQPPPKPAEDDWEPMPEGGFKPSETKTAAAKPVDDWQPMPEGGFKPEKAEEPRGFTTRMTEGWEGGFGKEPLGISPENLQKYPMLQPWNPLIAPLDFLYRLPSGLAGGVAGWIAGVLEKNPDALIPYGVDRQTADRIQREADFAGKAALAEMGSRVPKAPEALTRPREPLPRDVTPPLPAEGTAPLPLEGGGTRTPQQPQLPLEPPRDQYRTPQPELPLRTPTGEQGQLPLPTPEAPAGGRTPAGRGGELVTPPAPELPGPGGRIETQTEMPLQRPIGREATPAEPHTTPDLFAPAGEQGQLPFPHQEAPAAAGRTERHGTPGAQAAAGTAEMQPLPPTPRPGEPGWLTAARGPEDYGKETRPRGAGGGMNVGDVDPTLRHALTPEPRAAPGEVAPPAAAAAARPGEAVRGPIPEIPGGAQKGGGNIVRPLEERPVGELLQLARQEGLSPFMRDSLSNELERRGIRRMPEPAPPARPELPNVGAQLRAREEAARRATQEATAPGPVRQFLQDERGGGRLQEPIRREPVERGRSGRPIRTAPLPIGTERAILERGAEKATGPRLPPEQAPPFRQAAERQGLTSFERAKKMTVEQLQGELARADLPKVQRAVFNDVLRGRGVKPEPAAIPKAEAPKAAAPLTPSPSTTVSRLGEKIKTPEVLTKIAESWKRTFQPEAISEQARRADPQFAKYATSKAGEIDRIVRNSLKDERFWDKQTPEKQLKFLSDVENKRAVDPEFKQYEGRARKLLEEAYKAEKEMGSKAGYVEDYFPHIWERKRGQPPINEQLTKTLGPTWFQKARTFDMIEEGIKAGYELKYKNPEALLRDRLISGADMRMKMQLLQDLEKMGLAGKLAGEEVRPGWQRINAPDRAAWVIAPDVAHLWKNAVESRGLWANQGVLGDAFRGWMTLKNVWIPVKLALSAFHPIHVAGINLAHNWARAADQVVDAARRGDFNLTDAAKSFGQGLNPFTSAKGKMGKAQWLLGEAARTEEGKLAVKTMEEGGFNPMLSEQLRIDAGKKLRQSLEKMNPFSPTFQSFHHAGPAAFHGLRFAVQQLQAPIFETWIPRLKTGGYLNDAAALLQRQPELLNDPVKRGIALRQIAKSVDNRFGEMFYGSLFWDRYVKDAGIGSFLSLGWNLGFVREFGGAAAEVGTRPLGKLTGVSEARQIARDATNKIKFAGIYFGTSALIGGLITKLFTGENPKDTNDYIFPRMGGTNPDGSPRRMTTMFYTREIPMLMKHVQEQGGGIKGTAVGAMEMVWSKMLYSPLIELARNRSYFGKEIYDPDAPAFQELKQAITHVLKEQTSPMSVTGAQKNISTGADSIAGRVMPFLGFGPAPAYAERSAIQNRITHLYQEHVAPGSRPYEDPEVSKAQMDARNKLLMARQSGDQEKISAALKEAREAGMSPKYLATVGKEFGDQKMFRRLPQSDQMHLLERASPEEQKRYWPFASNKTKQEWRKQNPNWQLQR